MMKTVLIFPLLFALSSVPLALASQEKKWEIIAEKETQRLLKKLRERQNPDGSWGPNRALGDLDITSGTTALAIVAMNYAGLDQQIPTYKHALKNLLKNPPKRLIYSRALYIMALQMSDARLYKKQIQAEAQRLINAQGKGGTWNYFGTGDGDNSVTQFALLGLNAAKDAGIDIPERVWNLSRQHYLKTQNSDAGWPYNHGESSVSMTAAGLASLSICGQDLEHSLELTKGAAFIGQYKSFANLKNAFNLLGTNIRHRREKVFANEYLAYSIERAGMLHDRLQMNGIDWYLSGLKTYSSTSPPAEIPDLCFRLLFTAKGNTPILIGKLNKDGSINNFNLRKYDVRNATRILQKRLGTPLQWSPVNLSEDNPHLGKVAILYWGGFHTAALTKQEKQLLKSFISEKGVLLLAPYLDSPDFLSSCSDALDTSSASFEKVPDNHILRTMYYDLRNKNLPVKILQSHCGSNRIYKLSAQASLSLESGESSPLLEMTLTNLARYAMRHKPLVKKLKVNKLKQKESSENTLSRNSISDRFSDSAATQVALHIYGPISQEIIQTTYEHSLSAYRKRTQSITHSQMKSIQLNDLNLRNHPLLIISGSGKFTLDAAAKQNLKNYINSGGVVFAEAACSCPEFDISFRKVMEELLQLKWQELTFQKHPLWETPHAINWPKQSQNIRPAPFSLLKGSQGVKVLYTPFDLTSAISGTPTESERILFPKEHALNFFCNIINFCLSE